MRDVLALMFVVGCVIAVAFDGKVHHVRMLDNVQCIDLVIL